MCPIKKIENKKHELIRSVGQLKANKSLQKTRDVLLTKILGLAGSTGDATAKLLTIGTEHEFFLLNFDGTLVDWTTSQKFLTTLSMQANWCAYKNSDHDGSAFVTASRDQARGRYTAVKYEYPPYMLEIAFSWFDNVNDLATEIKLVFEELEKVANILKLKIDHSPFNTEAQDRLGDVSICVYPKQAAAEHSRSVYLSTYLDGANSSLARFPSYTASTQHHIGGLRWWDDEQIFVKLYTMESALSLYAPLLLTKNRSKAHQIHYRRWKLYYDCFPDFPLVGMPKFDDWTFQNWVSGLMLGPLVGGADQPWAGKRLVDIDVPTNDALFFVPYLRDLQSIRPRTMGTIEFRSDCALPDAASVISASAVRFGMTLLAAENFDERKLYSDSFEKWHLLYESLDADVSRLNHYLNLIKKVFQMRGMGEEKWLMDLESI